MAAPAGQSPDTNSEPKNVAPVNGRVYAKQKADAYMEAFIGVYRCVVQKTSVYKEEKYDFNPKDLYFCAAPLQTFKESRIQLDFGPPLIFESEKEEQTIRADAALIDSLHEHICNIFNQLVAIRNTKAQGDILAYQNIGRWVRNDAQKALPHLQELSNLLKQYADLKKKGHMVSSPFPHFEASSATLREMTAIVGKLAKFIAFNVDSRHFCPVNKGLFLVDFDSHSAAFRRNADACIHRMEALADRFRTDQQWLINHGINDMLRMRTSPVFGKLYLVPAAMLNDICLRSIEVFDLITDELKLMREGQGDRQVCDIFKQRILQGTIFSANADFSYVKAVRDVVASLMLNTVDKNNNVLKHSIRGQL